VIENRVLRNVFGHKSEGITGDWRKRIIRSFVVPMILLSTKYPGDPAKEHERGLACGTQV